MLYSLAEVLGRDWAGKKTENFPTKQLWEKLTKYASCLPLVFFQEPQYFSGAAASVLGNFFDVFAKKHKKLADRALKDSKEMNRLDDSYTAKPAVFSLYEEARRDFAEALLPLLSSNKKQIVNALLGVMEVYHKRAQEHFSKLRGAFENTGT